MVSEPIGVRPTKRCIGDDRGAAVALTPLTRVQQATVLALVEGRRLDVVPADLARARSFMRRAEARLNQLPLLTRTERRSNASHY